MLEPLKCTCGEPEAQGVVHRYNGEPCWTAHGKTSEWWLSQISPSCCSHCGLPNAHNTEHEELCDQDTKTCTNGHVMTGMGFIGSCPECEAPWKQTLKCTCQFEKENGHIFDCPKYIDKPMPMPIPYSYFPSPTEKLLREEWLAAYSSFRTVDEKADFWLAKISSLQLAHAREWEEVIEEVKGMRVSQINGSGCSCGREWWFRENLNKKISKILSLLSAKRNQK